MKNLIPKIKNLFTLKIILIISIGLLQFAFAAILLLTSGWSFSMVVLRLLVVAAMAALYYIFYEVVFYHGEQNGRLLPWLNAHLSLPNKTNSPYVEGRLDAFAEVLSRVRAFNTHFLQNLKQKILRKLQ